MLELLFVIGFFVMLLVTGVSLAGDYRGYRGRYRADVRRRVVCLDDQITAVAAAGRGGGVDYSGAEIPERKRFSRQ